MTRPLSEPVLRTAVALQMLRSDPGDDRGEGVISAAIVVLIMALLGAAMWIAFNGIFTDATNRAGDEINRIGG
ncbi:MAG: hypothetical protein AAFZ07_00965 [Actinomycetota bacterium]